MTLVPISLDATVSCISLQDPAIDTDRMELVETQRPDGSTLLLPDGTPHRSARYMRERQRDPGSWRELVPMRDGCTPTVFVIGVVPAAELNRIEDECQTGSGAARGNELGWRCFLHGLRDIEGFANVQRRKVHDVDYVDPAWLARVFVGPLRNIAVEIGNVIWHWNNLAPDMVKN